MNKLTPFEIKNMTGLDIENRTLCGVVAFLSE
ncbi:MAG: hypothetical protein J07AB43_16770 [Candidatus Nanosalina sp. J07AB43]|nr:MAG: hypothetical protein J07AB43_16770 [Candidatus Nanosalina sp. J07AB43]